MEILIKEPLKSITKVSVENLELSTLLHLIDCDTIEVINIPVFKEENIILLVDEDGKLKDKKFNFEIYHGGIAKTTFVGNVIFAGINKILVHAPLLSGVCQCACLHDQIPPFPSSSRKLFLSCPQAPLMSRPISRRTVTLMPFFSR